MIKPDQTRNDTDRNRGRLLSAGAEIEDGGGGKTAKGDDEGGTPGAPS
jgi:hypothetical protein